MIASFLTLRLRESSLFEFPFPFMLSDNFLEESSHRILLIAESSAPFATIGFCLFTLKLHFENFKGTPKRLSFFLV